MEIWNFLKRIDKKLNDFCISKDWVYVFFQSKDALMADFESESRFDPLKRVSLVKHDNFSQNQIYPKCLRLAGSAWRIKSLGFYILSELESDQKVKIIWHKTVKNISNIPKSDVIIWTVGTTHLLPDIYSKYCRIQGIPGCWLTIPNKGFNTPFKVSLPQPSGYINVTPDGDLLHISGGFGWTGELNFYQSAALMEPVKQHFLKQIAMLFKIPINRLKNSREYHFGICVRPSSPTGLPDVRDLKLNGIRYIFLSGSGKSGSTQAPLLGLFVTSNLSQNIFGLPYFKSLNRMNKKIIQEGLNELFALSKEERDYTDTKYPKYLEEDLFAISTP